MITDGIITGAMNPMNEGLTVREVLTKNDADIVRLVNSLSNTLVPQATALSIVVEGATALVGNELAIALADGINLLSQSTGCGFSLMEAAAYYLKSRTVALNLIDCGVSPAFSNIEAVFIPVFGGQTQQAIDNIYAVISIVSAMEAAFTLERLSGFSLAFSEVGAVISSKVQAMHICTGAAE